MKTQTFSFVTLKNIFLMCLCVATIALFSACDKSDDPDGPDADDEEEQVDPDQPSGDAITCAQAREIALALDKTKESDVEYIVVGYITDVFSITTPGKQSFWMNDEKGNEKTFQAAFAYLPDGVSTFVKNSKVSIKGKLKHYVKSNTGESVPEINNPTVTILEEGSAEGGDDTPAEGLTGDGTKANPYTVADVIALNNTKDANEFYYVKGYIVGQIKAGQTVAEGNYEYSNFTATDKGINTNIVIATSASETTDANTVIVQLPSGAVRDGLNLPQNPSVLGKEVLLYGNLVAYFKTVGVKNATYAEIDGTKLGQDPDATEIAPVEGANEPGATPAGTVISCADAVKACTATESTEIYSITGYITALDGVASLDTRENSATKGLAQQKFWIDDAKGSKKTFYAFFCSLRAPYKTLQVGTKVKITGKIVLYTDKSGTTTPEMKNGIVDVLSE